MVSLLNFLSLKFYAVTLVYPILFFVCLNFQTATNNLDGRLIIIANRCKNMYEWKFLIVSFFYHSERNKVKVFEVAHSIAMSGQNTLP
jgi:hypothetical protein